MVHGLYRLHNAIKSGLQPHIDAGVVPWTLHRVRLARASLTVRQNTDVVAVNAGGHQRLRVLVYLDDRQSAEPRGKRDFTLRYDIRRHHSLLTGAGALTNTGGCRSLSNY